MPDNVDIRVTFRNAAKRGLKRLADDLRKVDKGAVTAAQGMKGFYTQMAGLAALLGGGALFASSIKTFADFDDNMRAAAAVTSATSEELGKMTEIAKEMGRTTRYTSSNAAEALRFLGMAGFEATEATEALPGVLNLAAAGALDLGTAADIATNVLSAFGLEVEQLSQVNDVLVKTFTSANVNLVEVGEAFKMVGPIAKGVGADFEDLVATIGALGNAGIKGTLAGTSLKNAIDALLAPTGKEAALMKKFAERIGQTSLQVRDSQGNFIGFAKVIEQIEKAGVRGDEILSAFGMRAGPGLAALMNMGSDSLKELTEALRTAGGTSEEIAEKMEAGLGGELRRTKSMFESFKIALAEAFGPSVIELLKLVQQSFKRLIDLIGELAEGGEIQAFGNMVIEVFKAIDFAITKTYRLIRVNTAVLSTLFAKITGNAELAKVSFEGLNEEMQKLVGAENKNIGKPITDEMRKTAEELDKAAAKDSPIGRGATKVGNNIKEQVVQSVSMETELKAALVRLNATLRKEEAELQKSYDNRKITIEKYFNDRLRMVAEKAAAERAILENQLATEDNIDKKAILNAKIFALDEGLAKSRIEIEADRLSEQNKLEKEAEKKQKSLNNLKLKADQAYKDQKDRILQGEGATTLDAQFQDEISKLQERQNKELELVRQFHEQKIANLEASKASELEIEQAYQDQKFAIEEQTRLQSQEREQVAADQAMRLSEYKVESFKQIAGGASQAFGALYEMLGKENKELFYLAKAAAIAEATMNVAQGVTKAMAQGGIMGIAQGAIVAAAGAAQIASIASQGLADGGEVQGFSPSTKADNIGIMATAGEFMQPVSAVQHYGKGVMEAIRTKSIPRGLFAGYANGGLIEKGRGRYFADGGMVGSPSTEAPASGNGGGAGVNIINVTDPSQIDQYLSTSDGQDAILNVLGARPEAARRMLNGA